MAAPGMPVQLFLPKALLAVSHLSRIAFVDNRMRFAAHEFSNRHRLLIHGNQRSDTDPISAGITVMNHDRAFKDCIALC